MTEKVGVGISRINDHYTLVEVLSIMEKIRKQIKLIYEWEIEEFEDASIVGGMFEVYVLIKGVHAPSIPITYNIASDFIEIALGYPKDFGKIKN